MDFGRWTILAALFVIFITNPPITFAADNLLVNPDFEDFDGDVPKSWTKNYSTLQTSAATDAAHSGAKAVQFQSSSNSTKYLFQVVAVAKDSSYQFSGWTKTLSGSGNQYLRVTQCSDLNCSSEIKSDDSGHELTTVWKNLTVSFYTESSAIAVKAKISLDPGSTASVTALWDDLNLVKVAPAVSPIPTPTENPISSSPEIGLSFPGNLSVNSAFNLAVTTKNLPAAAYLLKIRLGLDGNHLTSGRTYNSGWLSDNDSWTKFPQMTPDSSGNWSGNLTAMLPSGESSGDYKIQVRLKKADKDIYYTSEIKNLYFNAESKTPSPLAIGKISPTLKTTSVPSLSVKTPSSTQTGSWPPILGSSSARSGPQPLEQTVIPKRGLNLLLEGENAFDHSNYLKGALIGSGILLTSLGLAMFWKGKSKRYNQAIREN